MPIKDSLNNDLIDILDDTQKNITERINRLGGIDMNQERMPFDPIPNKKLASWIRTAVIILAGVGAILLIGVVPLVGQQIAWDYPEFAHCYWPWLLTIWCAAIPCYAVLFLAWCVGLEVGRERPFTYGNARRIRRAAQFIALDIAYFLLMNIVLLFMNMSHPGIFILSLFVCFAGGALAICALVLSHLIGRAAKLQDDSDLTI